MSSKRNKKDHPHLTAAQKDAIRKIAIRVYAAGDGANDVPGERAAEAVFAKASIAECLAQFEDSDDHRKELGFDPETGESDVRPKATLFARLSQQGTACAETCLCAAHLGAGRSRFANPHGLTNDDQPQGGWVECTANESLECQVCGATGTGNPPL